MNIDNENCLIVSIVLVAVFSCILLSSRSALAQSGQSASLYVFVSDLHLGVGRNLNSTSTPKSWHPFEDFRWHDAFKKFLGHIDKQGGSNTTLIMLGDVFELWQSRDAKCEPGGGFIYCVVNDCVDTNSSRPANLGCTEDEIMVRLENIIANHKEIFDDLIDFLSKGENRLVIVPGNHDAGTLYPRAIRRLAEIFGGERFEFAERGYWFHQKLKLLAEHGHQFDLANQFKDWPKPFTSQNDRLVYLERSSGEQLVQYFYNSYEAQYPVLDNVTDELEAAKIITRETGVHGLFHGVSEFFKLLFLRMSFPQATAFLGDENKQGEPIEWLLSDWENEWAKDWTNPAFVVQAVTDYDDARRVAERAIRENKLDVTPASLSTQQLIGLCELRHKLVEEKRLIKSCPRKNEAKAGEITRRIFNIDALPDYLRSRKTQFDSQLSGTSDRFLQPINLAGDVFNVFIYGHTHVAHEAKQWNIDGWEVRVANTGAFHRVVTPSRLIALIESKKEKSLAQVTVEDLPDCYSFITVDPKLNKTQPELYYWVGSANGTFRPEKGEKGCPDH